MHVSVVVPLYNKAARLNACLTSVSRQTHGAYEVIIVDDGSTDGSPGIAETFLGLPESRVIRKANGGAASARNEGAANASGEYLAFLDADDVWDLEFLERMLSAALKTNADFVGCGWRQVNHAEGGAVSEFVLEEFERGAAIDMDGQFWTAFKHFLPINSSCNLIRREAFLAVGGFPINLRQREDLSLWAKLWVRNKFAFVNDILSQINTEPSGLSANRSSYAEFSRFVGSLARSYADAQRVRRSGRSELLAYLVKYLTVEHAAWVKRRVLG